MKQFFSSALTHPVQTHGAARADEKTEEATVQKSCTTC